MSCESSDAEAKNCTSLVHPHCCMQGCSGKAGEKTKPFCSVCADNLDGSFVSNAHNPEVFSASNIPADAEDLSDLTHATDEEAVTCANFLSCTNTLCRSFHCAEFGCARSICRVCIRSCGTQSLVEVRENDHDTYSQFRCRFHCFQPGHKEAYMTSVVPTNNSKCSLISPMPHCSNFAHRHCADMCLSEHDHPSMFCVDCCGEGGHGHCIVNHCSGEEDCALHRIVSSTGNVFGFAKDLKKNIVDPKNFMVRLFDSSLAFKSTFLATNFVEGYSVPLLAIGSMMKLGFVPRDGPVMDTISNICSLIIDNANLHQLRIKYLMDQFVDLTSPMSHNGTTWAVIFNVLVVYFAAKYGPNPHLVVKGEYPIKYATQDMEDEVKTRADRATHDLEGLKDLITSQAYLPDYKSVNQSIRDMSVGQIIMSARGARHMSGLEFSVPKASMHHLSPMMGGATPGASRPREAPPAEAPPPCRRVEIASRETFYSAFATLLSILHGTRLSALDEDIDDYDAPLSIPLSLLTDPDVIWDDFMTDTDFQIRAAYGPKGVM